MNIQDTETGSYKLMVFYSRACIYSSGFKQLNDVISKASSAAGLEQRHFEIVMHFARNKIAALRMVNS